MVSVFFFTEDRSKTTQKKNNETKLMRSKTSEKQEVGDLFVVSRTRNGVDEGADDCN